MASNSTKNNEMLSTSVSVVQDEPLQLIQLTCNSNNDNMVIKLVEETYSTIIKKASNRPLSIICVCGPRQPEKRIFLDYLICYLETLEKQETDWMDREETSIARGRFNLRNGRESENQGIWVWSRPFIISDNDDKEFAVLLVETKETNGKNTTTKNMSAIVGLSFLASSIMIFDCFDHGYEYILGVLHTYTQYGQLVLKNAKETPFQRLMFLITTNIIDGNYNFSCTEGKKYLEDMLQVKPDQPVEARQVKESIRKCFQDVDCFMMPGYIKMNSYYLNIDLNPNFVGQMKMFVSNLICGKNVVAKKILGVLVTAAELRSYLDCYIKTFNSNVIPSAENLWKATAAVYNNNMVQKASQIFSDIVKEKITIVGMSYLQQEELDKTQRAALKKAREHFYRAKKFVSTEKIAEYEAQLERNIITEQMHIKQQNDRFIGCQQMDELVIFNREICKLYCKNLENWENSPYPLAPILHEQFRYKLKSELNDTFKRVEKEVVELQVRMEKDYQKAEKKGLTYYKTSMTSTLLSSDFLSDFNLFEVHDKLEKETKKYYEDFKMNGFSDDVLTLKVNLEQGIEQEFTVMMTENNRRRKLAHSKAKDVVNDCHAKYKDVMKGVAMEELHDLHKRAAIEAENLFQMNCPGKDDVQFIGQYKQELNRQIQATWEKLEDVFGN